MQENFFIVGCGYVGQRLARQALAQGVAVSALSRSAENQAHLRELGLLVWAGDLDRPASLPDFPLHKSLLYYFAPPPDSGVADPRSQNFIQHIQTHNLPRKVVLISTTSVYGDCQGAWITEIQPLNPQAERAKRRVDAEQRWQAWAQHTSVPLVILRVPGIYGPGRLPRHRLEQGLPVLAESDSPYSNRIHVEDLVQACLAAGKATQPEASLYHLSDGNPTTMTDYFNQVADSLGLPRPPCISATQASTALSAEMRSYLAESKRLDTRKMREELGVTPRYPDLHSGLAQCRVAEAAAA